MAVFRSIKAVGISTLALASAITGVVFYASALDSPTRELTASPSPTESAAEANALAARQIQPELASAVAAREETLTGQFTAIAEHDRAVAEAEAARRAEAEQFLAQHGYEQGTTDPREIARQMMLNKYGWGDAQFQCYDDIIMKESRWITTADNPTSSAYGIPQALPGKKMASAGADWLTNPATQIKWGLGYVADRYGTPCQALSFRRVHNWY